MASFQGTESGCGFQVAWYLSESTESLALLSRGEVDIALTYIPAAEDQVVRLGNAIERVYAFRVRPPRRPIRLAANSLPCLSRITSP